MPHFNAYALALGAGLTSFAVALPAPVSTITPVDMPKATATPALPTIQTADVNGAVTTTFATDAETKEKMFKEIELLIQKEDMNIDHAEEVSGALEDLRERIKEITPNMTQAEQEKVLEHEVSGIHDAMTDDYATIELKKINADLDALQGPLSAPGGMIDRLKNRPAHLMISAEGQMDMRRDVEKHCDEACQEKKDAVYDKGEKDHDDKKKMEKELKKLKKEAKKLEKAEKKKQEAEDKALKKADPEAYKAKKKKEKEDEKKTPEQLDEEYWAAMCPDGYGQGDCADPLVPEGPYESWPHFGGQDPPWPKSNGVRSEA